MKLVFFGTPDFAVPSLRALHESHHEVLGVVTNPDKKSVIISAFFLSIGSPYFRIGKIVLTGVVWFFIFTIAGKSGYI